MKIKTKYMDYDRVLSLKKPKRLKPKKPSIILNTLIRLFSESELKKVNFTYEFKDRNTIEKGPYLILMNHSSFIDLEIVSKIFFPMKYNIVCTSDGFVGKRALLRAIGGIPTNKFVYDMTLINDILYSLKKNKTSVLMYPEASYSFDGTATALPRGLGRLLKATDVPVIMIKTFGAFTRDPLYNCLQKRKVNVSASVKLLFSKQQIRTLSAEQLSNALDKEFDFDNFAWQYENKISINEPFRADGLEKILYKCATCKSESTTVGKGEKFTCTNCGKTYYLSELGQLIAEDGKSEFNHIPTWYKWQRDCVKDELLKGIYSIDIPVSIGVLTDFKAIYMIGEGRLQHNKDGFTLVSNDGKLTYEQKPLSSYSLYADYFWYEIDDVICIGNNEKLYYCFPKDKKYPVAKIRLATEELYKILKNEKRN